MSDKAPSFRSANSRLKGGLRPEMSAVCYPVPDERIAPVIDAVHRFDKAHIVMLSEVGLIDKEAAAKLLTALVDLEADPQGVVQARLRIGGGNHSGEKHLTQALGEGVAGKIHAGRSSGDISAVANRITQQHCVSRTMSLVMALRQTLLALAERDRGLVVMGYSHLQHAQPSTLGHYWVSWLAVLERDFARLNDLHRRFDSCPAGSAVLTGSRFPLKPERTAELLGFGQAFLNSRDASWGSDGYMEAAAALSIVMNTCGRIAEDLYLWSTHEFGLIELADGFCINSSILPQKKNPIALEHVRGVAKVCVGRMSSVFSVFSAPTDSVVFDRYLATAELWRSFEDGFGALELLSALLKDMTVNENAARRAFKGSWFWTSDLAAALTLDRGFAWRTAQQSASVLVRRMMDADRSPESVTETDVMDAIEEYSGQRSSLPAGFVDSVRDPRGIVESRIVAGGPEFSDVARQIAILTEACLQDAATLARIEDQRERGERALALAVESVRA